VAESALIPSRGAERIQKILAGLVLFALLVKIPGLSLIPAPGLLFAAALFPVIIRKLRLVPDAMRLLWFTMIALLCGAILALALPESAGTGGTWGTRLAVSAWLISMPLVTAAGLWASRYFSLLSALRLVFLGGLLGAFVAGAEGGGVQWKGALGIYATLVVLAAVAEKAVIFSRVVLLVAMSISAVSDARTMVVIAGLVLLSTFATPQVRASFRSHPIRSLVLLSAGAAVAILVAILAMTSGLFGETIQQRTLNQMSGGRSLLETGRAEWAASLHLLGVHPWGFGTGTVVNSGLARDAVSAVASVGGDATASYFRIAVFGERTDLHSILADLWFHYGLGGVGFAGACIVLLIRATPLAIRLKSGYTALTLFAFATGTWDLFFSPMANSDRLIAGLLVAAILVLNHSDSLAGQRSDVAILVHKKANQGMPLKGGLPKS
jgi:hypothetical protein